jgi:hypothetical protein
MEKLKYSMNKIVTESMQAVAKPFSLFQNVFYKSKAQQKKISKLALWAEER